LYILQVKTTPLFPYRGDSIVIAFTCAACGKSFSVSDDKVGMRAKCLNCGKVVRVPDEMEDLRPLNLKGSIRNTRPPVQQEPWYYSFLENYATVVSLVGAVVCGVGWIITLIGLYGFMEKAAPAMGVLLFLVIFLTWGLLYLGLAVGSALVLVVVDGARKLRAIQQGREGAEA
jgi:hypothetical protein